MWESPDTTKHGNRMNEEIRELAKQFNDAQAKYTEVLMAMAGACIGLTVARTTSHAPTWSMICLALAVLSWGYCILAGVQNRQCCMTLMLLNNQLLQTNSSSSGAAEAMEYEGARARRLTYWQLYSLLGGAVLFLIWHVIDMFDHLPAN